MIIIRSGETILFKLSEKAIEIKIYGLIRKNAFVNVKTSMNPFCQAVIVPNDKLTDHEANTRKSKGSFKFVSMIFNMYPNIL